MISQRRGLSASSSYLDELVEELESNAATAESYLEQWLDFRRFEQLEPLVVSTFWLCQTCRDCMTRFGSEGGSECTIKSLEDGLRRFEDVVSKLLRNIEAEAKEIVVVFNQTEDQLGHQLNEFLAHTVKRFSQLEDGIAWLNQKRHVSECVNLWTGQPTVVSQLQSVVSTKG